ncbi:uncharacterized protein Dwil_GK28154 [Drosophila willistoni]|nr:uncharacterized protein Dwil_GK28154 [Drosophila willistoni]
MKADVKNIFGLNTWNEDCNDSVSIFSLGSFALHGLTGIMLIIGNYRESHMLYHWLIITLSQIALMLTYIVYGLLLTDMFNWIWCLEYF